jgi:hypothetical protein
VPLSGIRDPVILPAKTKRASSKRYFGMRRTTLPFDKFSAIGHLPPKPLQYGPNEVLKVVAFHKKHWLAFNAQDVLGCNFTLPNTRNSFLTAFAVVDASVLDPDWSHYLEGTDDVYTTALSACMSKCSTLGIGKLLTWLAGR